jgi:hypothetical protein
MSHRVIANGCFVRARGKTTGTLATVRRGGLAQATQERGDDESRTPVGTEASTGKCATMRDRPPADKEIDGHGATTVIPGGIGEEKSARSLGAQTGIWHGKGRKRRGRRTRGRGGELPERCHASYRSSTMAPGNCRGRIAYFSRKFYVRWRGDYSVFSDFGVI